jgi:hypothetical protein
MSDTRSSAALLADALTAIRRLTDAQLVSYVAETQVRLDADPVAACFVRLALVEIEQRCLIA